MKLTYALGLSACAVAYAIPIERRGVYHDNTKNGPAGINLPRHNPDGFPREKRSLLLEGDPDLSTPDDFLRKKRDGPATDDSTNNPNIDTIPFIPGDGIIDRLPPSELGKIGNELKPGTTVFSKTDPGVPVDDDDTNPPDAGADPMIPADNIPGIDKDVVDETIKIPSKRGDPPTTGGNVNPLNAGADPLIEADGTNKALTNNLPSVDKLKGIADFTTPPSVPDDNDYPLHPEELIPLEDILDGDDNDHPVGEATVNNDAPKLKAGAHFEPPA